MDERSAVNQFDHSAQAYRCGAVIARVSGGEQQKRGTQAFSAAPQQISGDLADRFAGEAGFVRQYLLNAREIVAHQIKNLFYRQQ